MGRTRRDVAGQVRVWAYRNFLGFFRSLTTVKSQAARGLETLRTLVAHPVTAD
jgi:hypothetical protein